MAESTENTQNPNPVFDFNSAVQSLNMGSTQPTVAQQAPQFTPPSLSDAAMGNFNPMPMSRALRDIGGNGSIGPNRNPDAASFADYLNNDNFAFDPKSSGAVSIYGANNDGLRFQKAYVNSAYDRLGFSPYRDNLGTYMSYGSGWEDFKTALAPNALFKAGAVDMFTNWFEWGEPTDPSAARFMTDTMELYQTPRQGFWGNAANTMASLQYSMGAITEFAAEEAALIGITALSKNAQVGELSLLRTIRNVGALGRTISVGSELLNTIRTVDKAKDFWQAAKFAGAGTAKTANALLNPFYRTTSNLYDTYKGVRAGKTTAEIAKNKAYFGDFFRDMSEINMALSEGRLEGGITQNEIYDGIMKSNPNISQREAELAYELALKGGSEATNWNTMTIYMTNKFVFDGLLGKMLPKSSRLLRLSESLGGKYVMDKGKRVFLEDGFGKNLRRAVLPFSKEGKLFYKHYLQTAPSRFSNFALGSSMEGLQENAQEMLNIAYTDYYTALYNTPEIAQAKGLRASISKGIQEQFTSQGLQTFLSGFAIGGGLGAYSRALNWSMYKAPMIVADKTGISKEYSTAKEKRAEFRKQMTDIVADLDSDPISYFNAMENDLAHQVNFYEHVFASQNAGDNKQAKVGQDAQLLKRIQTLFKAGQVDLLRDTFKEYLKMSDEDLQTVFPGYKLEGDTNNKPLRDRVENILSKVDVMEKSFKEAEKIENPYNPFNFDRTKEPEKYNEEAYKYLAVEEVKFDLAFLKTNTILAQQYVADILDKAGKIKPISNISGTEFTSILTNKGIKTEIDMLNKERIAYEQTATTSDKASAKLAEIDNRLSLLNKFLSAYELYEEAKKDAPANYIRNRHQKKKNGETDQTIDPVTDNIESHATDLRDAFFDVIKDMASQVNETPLSENIDDVFDALREMIDHGADFSNSVDSLNMLYDPAGFEAHHGRIKQALENVHKMHKENNTKIFDELQHRKDLNAFLNNLMDKGIFYDPKYAKAFEDDSVLPEAFIDSTTMEELDHTSPKYKDLLAEIDKFERATGKTLSGKLIPEFDPFETMTRVKRAKDDVRTMSTVSKQYGASEDTTESYSSTEDVLEALSRSPQATPAEKILAKRLKSLVSSAARVTFVRNLSQPVSYSEATGVLIDLRYVSIDYSGGILKAEPIILSGILKAIVSTEFEKNAAFKAKAQNLLNLAKQNILDKDNNFSQMPLGLDSVENFISEALTNLNFQMTLRSIEYTGERAAPKSLWQEFKKALSDFFAKIFKLAPGTKQTLLDEAVDLTAFNIDPNANMAGSTPATGGSSTNSTPTGVPVTQDMPFEEIIAIPEYAQALKMYYDDIVKQKTAQDPAFTPTEDDFKKFVTTDPVANILINNINIQTGRVNPNAQPQQPGSTASNGTNLQAGVEVISDDELRTFKETNNVSDDILTDIKTRKENGQDLTPRQHEIMQVYGDIVNAAIALQKESVVQTEMQDAVIIAEAEKLTMPQIFGPRESYPFGADKSFNLLYGGKLNVARDPSGKLTAVVFQNVTAEQVAAGESPKPYWITAILNDTTPNLQPLRDALQPVQDKIDEIEAKYNKPVETQDDTSTDIEAKKADIENKVKKLFSFTERGQISLAGEDYDLIKAVRNNPTNENIKQFLELYKSEIGKYEQAVIDEVDAELDALGGTTQAPATDQKADIERRRQEELRQNLSKTDFATSFFPALSQPNMSQGGGAYVEINFGKNNVFRLDTYLTPFAINGQYPSITDGTAQLYGEMSDGTKISLPWNQLKDLLNSIKAVNVKGEVAYEFDKNKINAKYDAELAALKGAPATTTTTQTEPEKTEEQEVNDDINKNPETRDDVNEGMSGVDNATTEVENELNEIERKATEGKVAPLTERAKQTLNDIREASAKLRESMQASYGRMVPAMNNAYEKLRRAHKNTTGKVREKLKTLLDRVLKFMRKLGTIVKNTYQNVAKRREKSAITPIDALPSVTVTGLEREDNTLDQLSDFITDLLGTYGFSQFFAANTLFKITPDVIRSLDMMGTKFGDSVLLGYSSPMEITLHKILHLFIDTRVQSAADMERFDNKAKVRIEAIKTILGQKIAEGYPYQDTLDKLNYILDKNPAHQVAAYFLSNREFRVLMSKLSEDSYRYLEILAKDMTALTDAKVRKFISLQDGLGMADDEYNNFEAHTSKSPLTILAEAIDNTDGKEAVSNLANQLATPIEELIKEEATAEELQEIADKEKKSVTEIITDIKNAVTRYLSSTTLGRAKTSLDQAPKTKKDGIIRRIWKKLRNVLIAMSMASGLYTGIAGFDMGVNSTTEEDFAKPTWSISNAIDNTMYWLPVSDAYKQTIMRGLIQRGFYDISNVKEAVVGDVANAKAIKESEDRLEYIQQNTYFESLGAVKDGQGSGTDSLLMYRNQWFNDVGFEYLAAPSNSTRDRVGQMTFNNTVGVAHFYIMDDTGGDLSRYTSAEKLAEARQVFKGRIGTYDIKPTDYVPVFKFMPQNEQGESIVKLQYKIASEITDDDIAVTKLLQWKFADIDWNSQKSLYKASYCLTTKTGAQAESFTFSKDGNGKDKYSRFSGSSIVFIFKDQKGNTIVREFTGSINGIKKEAESIMKDFAVQPEDLTLGAFDAGSFSAKPKSKSGALDTDQWLGFNKIHPHAGSALVIPVSSTTKTISLSDINPSQAEINNVINQKTKACK